MKSQHFRQICVCSLVCLLATAVKAQTTWYVDDDAPNDPGPGDPAVSDLAEDGSADHPFDAIQEGIDAAVAANGDDVLVLDGTYTGPGNKDLDFGGKAITVHSDNGPDNCIIDCEGNGRGFYFHSGEGPDAVVEGFSITNGSDPNGGAVHCFDSSNPTITNCSISGNSADYGGGIYCDLYSSPVVTNCTIRENTAAADGGGIICFGTSSPTIINTAISGNLAEYGGGGVFCFGTSDPVITSCVVSGNSAIDGIGGGVYCENSNPTIINTAISGNLAEYGGGGIYCAYANPIIVNCILWGDSPDEINVNSGSPVAAHSDIEGGTGEPWFGPGCIDTAPLFTNPGSGDYRLQPGSLCIDAGDNNAVPPDEADLDEDGNTAEQTPFDLDLNPRFVDDPDTATTGVGSPEHPEPEIVDMGAYEFQPQGGDTCWQVGTGDWSNADNWTAGEPSAAVTAYINNYGTAQITQAGEVCQSLWLGEHLGESGTVELLEFGELSSTEQYIGAGGVGTFTQTGGTNSVSNELYLGYSPLSDGTYDLSGGDLSASTVHVGYDYDGTAAFSWTGGTLDANTINVRPFGTLSVGQDWTYDGTLNINGGLVELLDPHDLILDAPGNGATVNLTSGDLVSRDQIIGSIDSATFTQTSGTNTVGYTLYLGEFAGSNGTYALSGTGELYAVNDHEIIGYAGSGQFTQTGGTNSVPVASLFLGHEPGSYGTYTISDGTLDVGYAITVGHDGAGAFNVSGGAVSSMSGLIGYGIGSDGTATVTGTGSQWIIDQDLLISNRLVVGAQSTGTLNITDGGYVRSVIGTVGKSFTVAGGEGEIYVDGSSSTLEYDVWLTVGGGGAISAMVEVSNGGWILIGGPLAIYSSGSITINTGATVSSSEGIITALSGLAAAATIDGPGSTWTNASSLYVGGDDYEPGDGTGTMTVDNEGTVDVGNTLKVWEPGTVNLNDGLIVADVAEVDVGATFNNAGGVLRVNGLSGFGDNVSFGGSLQIGHAGGGSPGGYTVGVSQSLQVGGQLMVGYDAPGQFTQTDGTISALDVFIGYDSTGTFAQSGGTNTIGPIGGLELAYHAGSTGTYELSGAGSLSASYEFIGSEGTGTFTQTGGSNVINTDLGLGQASGSSGTYVILAGVLNAGSLLVGGSGSGTFNITGAGVDITVSDLLYFGADSTFTAAAGNKIHMTGANFENESTSEVDLAGLANLELIFEGGTGQTEDLEVACEDKDTVMAGYDNNFSLGKLTVGGADVGDVRLVDNIDNGNRGGVGGAAEALYVDSLVLNAGSVLDLNGLHLYWRTEFVNSGGTIINGYMGQVEGLPGDLNCDGEVNGLDIQAFVWAVIDVSVYYSNGYGCSLNGDFDESGGVDELDVPFLVNELLNP
ncbi:MAG: hypothetical protein ABII12_05370 [Planctomycetota bacterium]